MSQEFDLVIDSQTGSSRYWSDLWRYRELFYFLAWRDILVRYKQTVIGIAWSVIRPLTTMAVFTLIFGRLAQMPTEGDAPYPLLVFAAMLPWQLFANALTESSNSLVANGNLLSKVYFPRLIVPASAVVVSLADFLISLALLGILLFVYGVAPLARIVALPLFVLLASASALGFGVWLSALNVQYRDVRYVVPFLVQLGLYVSPVGFSSAVVPEKWRLLYALNPLVGVIDGFRWAILGNSTPLHLPSVLLSAAVSSLVLGSGFHYFRRMERKFADVI